VKKILIGFGVLVVFVLYSLGIRHQNQTPVVVKPASLPSSTSTSTTTTAAGSGSPPPTTNSATTTYKDGTYTGSVADAYYGNVQVSATISGGKITGVKFLQYPNTHGTSVMINQQAMPYLIQEAIQAQSSNVQTVSGATFTTQAFQQSLQAALSQA
jgi:uncharacterized protein with FMN-binding domain